MGDVDPRIDVGGGVGENGVGNPFFVQHLRERRSIADLHPDALSAGLLQLLGAQLPDHGAVIQEAVVGGQAGELVEDVAGDEHRDLPLPVEL